MKKLITLLFILVALAACSTPEVVEVTRVVSEEVEVTRVVTETVMEEGQEVEVTRVVTETVVEEVVVTAEAEVEAIEAEDVLGLPRNQTMIIDMLTGRAGSPGNFNL